MRAPRSARPAVAALAWSAAMLALFAATSAAVSAFDLVAVLDGVLRVATGQTSTLAVTGSTLLVAFAFQPLRGRVQALVDRRFYRSRYDADRTLATFSGRLRDQLDLEALEREMLDVVRATVHPGHVDLWLRDREVQR